ncbi:hypothetical protein [Pseudonocardia sp.]|uniref:hypothetical protein n=1 Tax=Pseudonocardia sp. TaxID=60912 RepID=UPI003D0E5A59
MASWAAADTAVSATVAAALVGVTQLYASWEIVVAIGIAALFATVRLLAGADRRWRQPLAASAANLGLLCSIGGLGVA